MRQSPIASVGPLFFLWQALAFFVAWIVFAVASPPVWYERYRWVFFNLSQGTSLAMGITGTVFFALVIAAVIAKRRAAARIASEEEGPPKPRFERGSKARREGAGGGAADPGTGGAGDRGTAGGKEGAGGGAVG
jgi:hypothetical protein